MSLPTITLFANSPWQHRTLLPLMPGLQRLGCDVAFNEDMSAFAEVGIYCAPQAQIKSVNSHFSLIMPHDLAHHLENRQSFWIDEPWDRFDLGLLPGPHWQPTACEVYPRVRHRLPRLGCQIVGWPACHYFLRPASAEDKPLRAAEKMRIAAFLSRMTAERKDIIERMAAHFGLDIHLLESPSPGVGKAGGDPAAKGAENAGLDPILARADAIVSDAPALLLEAQAAGRPVVLVSDWWQGEGSAHAWPSPYVWGLPQTTLNHLGEFFSRRGQHEALLGAPADHLGVGLKASEDTVDDICRVIVNHLPADGFLPAPKRALLFVQDQQNAHIMVRQAFEDLLAAAPPSFTFSSGMTFDEDKYLARNADVAKAVAVGHFSSGLLHWQRHGRREGRQAFFKSSLGGKALEEWTLGSIGDGQSYKEAVSREKRRLTSSKEAPAQIIVVHAPPFNTRAGGCMSLYELTRQLRARGVDARIWVQDGDKKMSVGASVEGIPTANALEGLEDVVVIYPEVIDGNPLKSRRVIRWLLNRPGKLSRAHGYASTDLFMHFSPFCAINPDPARELFVLTTPATTSCDKNGIPISRTEHACQVVRKGSHLPRLPETKTWPEISEDDAEDYARAFHRYQLCFSYDAFTYLSVQAALCGATSVVCPQPGLTAAQWRNLTPPLRYGVAYGFDEIPWAEATRHLIADNISFLKTKGNLQVSAFVSRLRGMRWLA